MKAKKVLDCLCIIFTLAAGITCFITNKVAAGCLWTICSIMWGFVTFMDFKHS